MVKRAVSFGLNYAGTKSALSGCHNDSRKFRDMLVKYFGYKSKNVRLVLDSKFNCIKPTKAVILETLRGLVKQTKDGDTLFVHYSGHGTRTRDSDGDEEDHRDEAWYACDKNLVTDDELYEVLVRKFPKGAKLRVVSDSCHSGTMADLPFTLCDRKVQTNNDRESDTDCIMISGCRDNQTSADAYLDGSSIGALTWSLDKAVKTVKEPLKDFTWRELLTVSRFLLKGQRFTQVPQLSTTNVSLFDHAVDF